MLCIQELKFISFYVFSLAFFLYLFVLVISLKSEDPGNMKSG